MKYLAILLALGLISLTACKKDKEDNLIYGTVQTDAAWNTTYVLIKDPGKRQQDFLCDKTIGMLSSMYPNCGIAVAVSNLPDHLKVSGTKIKFSKWEFTAIPAAAHVLRTIEIKDAQLANW